MNICSILIVIGIVQIANSQQVPIFPQQYEVQFDEKAKIGELGGNTTGKIYLDAINNRQVVYRKNGRVDRYCGSVQKIANTPCNHYIADGKRFLDFPQKKYCCYCCDSAHGCGIVKPDWLKTANATFQGYQKLDDGLQTYAKWSIKGLQENLYYHVNDTLKTPRRLYQVPDDLMDFKNYYVGIKDESIFKVPLYCTDKCGLTTICAAIRGQSSGKRNRKQNLNNFVRSLNL